LGDVLDTLVILAITQKKEELNASKKKDVSFFILFLTGISYVTTIGTKKEFISRGKLSHESYPENSDVLKEIEGLGIGSFQKENSIISPKKDAELVALSYAMAEIIVKYNGIIIAEKVNYNENKVRDKLPIRSMGKIGDFVVYSYTEIINNKDITDEVKIVPPTGGVVIVKNGVLSTLKDTAFDNFINDVMNSDIEIVKKEVSNGTVRIRLKSKTRNIKKIELNEK